MKNKKGKLVDTPCEEKQILKLNSDNVIDDIEIKEKCMFIVEAELLESYEGNSPWDSSKAQPRAYQTFLITDIKKYKAENKEEKKS